MDQQEIGYVMDQSEIGDIMDQQEIGYVMDQSEMGYNGPTRNRGSHGTDLLVSEFRSVHLEPLETDGEQLHDF